MSNPVTEGTLPTQVGDAPSVFPDKHVALTVESAGDMIGPYKLVLLLGTGGMGSVWQADQEQPVRRTVALKLIKAGMDTAMVVHRFSAERQALALMDHPNIAKVLDAGMVTTSGKSHAGRPYFVMELVRGIPITTYCDEQRLTPRERLELFVPVCQAVQHAHQKGIIHRDLKPTNVLIGLYDGKPVPKVIDFGVAKATGESGVDGETPFTQFGAVIGTPIYMAPEQAENNNKDIDTRADIYALGVILYELLTGSTPFTKQMFQKAPLLEVFRMIREVEPPKPSTIVTSAENLPQLAEQRKLEPRRLSSQIQGDLDWIVMKCLEKDRNRRYETANGLAFDILRFLRDEPVLAGPPSAGYRLKKFVHRNRGGVIAAGLIFLAMIGAVVGTTLGFVQARQARNIAESERKIAVSERQVANAVSKFLQLDLLQQANAWEQADSLINSGRSADAVKVDPTIRELLDRSAEELTADKIESKFPGQPMVQAEILQTIGKSYTSIAEFEKAVSHLSRARDTFTTGASAADSRTLSAMDDLGLAFLSAGRIAEAIRLFEQVRDQRIKVLGPDHKDTISTRNNLAFATWKAGKLPEAIGQFEQLRDQQMRVLGASHEETHSTLNNLALAYRDADRIPDAIKLFEQLSREMKKGHPRLLVVTNNLASTLQMAGRAAEAVPIFEQVRDQQIQKLGPTHPETLTTLNNLAVAMLDVNRIEEAIALFKRVHSGRIDRLGADHPDTITTSYNLAMVLRHVKHATDAIELFEKIRDQREKKPGPTHPLTLHTLDQLALAYRDAGRTALAATTFEELLKRRQAVLGPDHDEVILTMITLAGTYRAANEFRRQESLLQSALTSLEKTSSNGWMIGLTRSMLGEALLDQGKAADAEQLVVKGYQDLNSRSQAIPPSDRGPVLIGAVNRLIRLYEANNQVSELEKWKLERDKLTAKKN